MTPFKRLASALLLTTAAFWLVSLGRPAGATVGFSYQWKTPRVTVNWSEGNESLELPALRRQVGHWKRLAQTLWSKAPDAAPLQMDVSLYGPEMGSEGPLVRLKSGRETLELKAPMEESQVFEALLQLRGTPVEPVPSDDSEPSISPDGQWIAFISWRGAGPEVWVTKKDASTVTRVPFVGGKDLLDRLVLTTPAWSADSRQVAWVQGGRLLIFDTRQRAARYVTDPKSRVAEFLWPPRQTGALLVTYDDNRFDLLDGVSGSAVPVSELLKGAAPTGKFFWSTTGQRLLFRTQGRIEVAALTIPGKTATAWDRFLNKALGGPPDPPQPRDGEHAERLAVLDLRARRLDAYPVTGTPMEAGQIGSVTWSPDEDTVFLAVHGEGDKAENTLVRFPLSHEGKPETVMQTGELLAALGWRSERFDTNKLPDPAYAKYAVLRGSEVLVSEDGKEYTSPYSPSELLRFEVGPGPQGGYLGVEGEVLTEDEPTQVIYLEDMAHTSRQIVRRAFPNGFLHTYTLDGNPMIPLIKTLMERKPVYADFTWDKGQSLAMAVLSPDGGVGELSGVAFHPNIETQAINVELSKDLGHATILAANPIEKPFLLSDVSTGTSTLALRYARFNPQLLLLWSAIVLAFLMGLVYVFRKWLAHGR